MFEKIYINLKGREGRGIVDPDGDFERLKRELIQKLAGLRDDEKKEIAIRDVFDAAEASFGAVSTLGRGESEVEEAVGKAVNTLGNGSLRAAIFYSKLPGYTDVCLLTTHAIF